MISIKDSITAFGVIAITLIPIKVSSAPVDANLYSNQLKCSLTSGNLENKSNYKELNSIKSYFNKHISFKTQKSGIIATFSPKNTLGQKIELQKLASLLGYERFAWVNYVEQDPYGIRDRNGKVVQTPYNDPPPGGYQYDGADNHPFYWDIEQCDNCKSRHHYQHPKITSKFQLVFEDHPSDPRLKSGESVNFVTHLVGIKKSHPNKNQAEWEILTSFSWKLTSELVVLKDTPSDKPSSSKAPASLTNIVKRESRVSLIKNNIDPIQLSRSLKAQIQADGGIINNLSIAHRHNLHNRQCRQQNHHNRDLDTFL